VIQGQSPCQGFASLPPLLPEVDSFSWMVIRPYGVYRQIEISPVFGVRQKTSKTVKLQQVIKH